MINSSFGIFGKKSEETFETYVIDLLFTNSLTIIRCNRYERQVLRGISMDTIGHIKCSNNLEFLPNNHIEQITLLSWNSTTIKCEKKTNVMKEKTYLKIIHKPVKAFKKHPLKIIRVGSIGSSDVQWKDKENLIYFEHSPRQLEEKDEIFSTEIYSFKHRPILCQERQLALKLPCPKDHQPRNLSYICYYRIGVQEPPTIADMNEELETLPNISVSDTSIVDLYLNRTPKRTKSPFSIAAIVGILIIIFVIAGSIIYYCFCRSGKDEQIQRIDSDTSIVSKIS